MALPYKTIGATFQRVIHSPFWALAFFSLLLPRPAGADIYRFVTIDGIETFTDAPVNRDARVVIRTRSDQVANKSKKGKAEKLPEVSLNEIAERTVSASINPGGSASWQFEPRLPPVGGVITSGTGMRIDPIDGRWRHHDGIDIALPPGTPVTPAAPGTVIYSGLRPSYGYTVIVEHEHGLITLYAHNSRLMAVNGQQVGAETVISLSGNTGRSTGPHLHFEAWQSGVNITQEFMPDGTQKHPIARLASKGTKDHFRREILADGSLLFTNIPTKVR